MGWVTRDEFRYYKKVLMAIAQCYDHFYSGLDLNGILLSYAFSLAEYKADFDRALDNLGRGHWTGHIDDMQFKQYNKFGKLQRIVIADIYGIDDTELERLHFKDVPRFRNYAYKRMADTLNEDSVVWKELILRLAVK